MAEYRLVYWFEHGGICIWGANVAAKEKYGYAIVTSSLPISNSLIERLNELEDEYHTYLDWEYPQNPSPWTDEHKQKFIKRATTAYEKICEELGDTFIVENKVAFCVL